MSTHKNPGETGSCQILFLLAFTLLLQVGCENDIRTINALVDADTMPAEYAKNIEVTYSESGRKQVVLESPLMKKFTEEEPYIEFPAGIQISFYDGYGKVKSQLTADYGIRYEKTRIMEARSHVVVVNFEKQEQLDTEKLVWDENKALIYSDVFVKITTPDDVIYGDGLESDENLDRYVIRNPSGEWQVETGEKRKGE